MYIDDNNTVTTDSSSSNSAPETTQDESVGHSDLLTVHTMIGICASILVILLTLLTVTILLVWRLHRKSAIQEHEFEQVDGSHPSAQFGGLSHSIPISDNEYQQTPFTGDTLSTDGLTQPMGNVYAELPHIDSDPIYSCVDVERPHQLREHQDTISPSVEEATENISTDVVYAVVNKSKKKIEKQSTDDDNSLQGPLVPPYNPLAVDSFTDEEKSATGDEDNKNYSTVTLEGMYATVNKKQKRAVSSELEEECVPVDTHSDRVNEPCTVVKQKAAETSSELEDEAQSKVTVEELYTVVKKKLKASAVEEEEGNKEEVPPIPPYTTERLCITSVEEITEEIEECT